MKEKGWSGFIGTLKCLVGLHEWTDYASNVDGDMSFITLVWWQCDRCAESKLKCILHNPPRQQPNNRLT